MNNALEKFKALYNDLNKNNLHLLDTVYSKDVEFIDPFHHINGLDNLHTYLERHYFKNLISCQMEYIDQLTREDTVALFWKMSLRIRKLRGGKLIKIHGCSLIKFTGELVSYHRAFYDGSELLYSNLPLLGPLIRKIKHIF